eukprot:symbB.v1.2.032187.t1/scaffold3829.1/size49562/1
MHGWPKSCWTTECLRKRFGGLNIEGGYDATLEDYLDAFFDAEDPPLLKANCLKGDSPPCTLQAGAPFCTRPCMINATLNFGIVDDSDPPFADVLETSLNSLPLLRARSLKGDTWLARLVTQLVPSTVGFAPDVDWVEAVLWLSPAGARTGLHQDDEPCSILYQVHGRKRLLLFSPKYTEHVVPAEKPHCLGEHGTRYSQLSWDEMTSLSPPPLEVILETGDAIFIPNAWWHAVEALGGPAVSISARGVTFCEGIAFLPFWLAILLQQSWQISEDYAMWLPHLLAVTLPLLPIFLFIFALQLAKKTMVFRIERKLG